MEMLNVMCNDRIGKIINDRYRIEEKLGSGSMGIVYRAIDHLTDDTVALKQVQLDTNKHANAIDYRTALAHEFKTMATLRHAHIIPVLDYGFDDENMPFFTMELIHNAQRLTSIAQQHNLGQQIKYLVQLLQALAYLHNQGIFHRDLKPDNVMVSGAGMLRVLDFGLALVRNEIYPTENAIGTLSYIAPETLQGYAPTSATDLYSVGMMAYEIFVGHHPFDTSDITLLISDTLNTLPNCKIRGTRADVMHIVEQLIQKNPKDRYQSAENVIAALNIIPLT